MSTEVAKVIRVARHLSTLVGTLTGDAKFWEELSNDERTFWLREARLILRMLDE